MKFGILGPAALLPHAQTGAIILIAQTSEKRNMGLPDVSTLVETGYKDMVLESWFGLFAPAGTPADAMKALNSAAAQALYNPVLHDNFTEASMEKSELRRSSLGSWRVPTRTKTHAL